ncbi:hypothetical protein L7F22_065169 [Adiantum nelumboides]|nr:hypothetical protein [Adiantum nelumboides]
MLRMHVQESWPSFDLGITDKNAVFDGGGTCRSVNTHGFQPSTIHRSFSAPTLAPVLNEEHAFAGLAECNACTVDGRSRTGSGFIEVDMDLEKEIAECGENRSKKKDYWARKRFDEYRRHVGIDDSIPIENLDLKEFAGMLEGFFKQVVKRNGFFYPSATLMNMFRCFDRILKRAQECRIADTGIEEVPFDICCNVFERLNLSWKLQ